MNKYLLENFGDPCRYCGYSWSTSDDRCNQIVNQASDRLELLLFGRSGLEQITTLKWNIAAYVAHIADNTRIWAERVVAVALGSRSKVASYDQSLLGQARNYQHLAIAGCLWSLRRAIGDWNTAMTMTIGHDIVLDHPEQGQLNVNKVLRIVAHEVHHHEGDITQILSGVG